MRKSHFYRLAALLFCLTPALSLAGPYAPAAGLPGSTAVNMNDAVLTSWATGYVDYLPASNVDAIWQTPERALGQAQGTSTDIVSLGTGGQITLTFADPIANGTGADFAVFENGFSANFLELARVEVSSDGFNFFAFDVFSLTPSPVSAFGSLDPTDIDGFAGKYQQGWGTPFDLAVLAGVNGLDINNVSYVRLLDVVGDGSEFDDTLAAQGGPNPIYDPYLTTGSAGFDLDAIGVMNSQSTIVPLPAAVWLLLSGISVLTLLARRKHS